jgi:hypothetical protein
MESQLKLKEIQELIQENNINATDEVPLQIIITTAEFLDQSEVYAEDTTTDSSLWSQNARQEPHAINLGKSLFLPYWLSKTADYLGEGTPYSPLFVKMVEIYGVSTSIPPLALKGNIRTGQTKVVNTDGSHRRWFLMHILQNIARTLETMRITRNSFLNLPPMNLIESDAIFLLDLQQVIESQKFTLSLSIGKDVENERLEFLYSNKAVKKLDKSLHAAFAANPIGKFVNEKIAPLLTEAGIPLVKERGIGITKPNWDLHDITKITAFMFEGKEIGKPERVPYSIIQQRGNAVIDMWKLLLSYPDFNNTILVQTLVLKGVAHAFNKSMWGKKADVYTNFHKIDFKHTNKIWQINYDHSVKKPTEITVKLSKPLIEDIYDSKLLKFCTTGDHLAVDIAHIVHYLASKI